MLIFIIILTILFPFLYKYSFVITNQYSQIPIILSFLDQTYLQNDWYVSVSRQFGPRTIFAFYMSLWARFIPLYLAFFLHYLIYIFFSTLAIYKLSFALIKKEWPAYLTTIIVLFSPTISLGSNILITHDFVAPQLPLGISILAVSFILERKYLVSAILFSFSSYLHPLIGFESAFVSFLSLLLVFFIQKEPVQKFIKRGLFPFIILSSPGAYVYLQQALSGSEQLSNVLEIVAFVRNPHHFVPSSFSMNDYVLFILMMVVFVVSVYLLKQHISKTIILFFLSFAVVILFFCLLGFIGTEIFTIYPVIALQPFRMTLFLYFIAYGAIVSTFFVTNKNKKYLLLTLIFITLTNYQQFFPFGKVKLVAVFAFLASFYFLFKKNKLPQAAIVLTIAFSLLFFHKKFNFSSYTYIDSDETKVAEFSNKETRKEAIFLVPPEFESFRLVSNRAIVIDWKSFPFQKQAVREWAEKICDLGNIKSCNLRKINRERVVDGYRRLGKKDILSLKEKYSFSYFISDRKYEDFNKIYSNRFNVYDLD